MKRLFSVIITIVVILSLILFMQPNIHKIVNAQSEENEIRENTLYILKKAIAAITKISESMKNASELITNPNETKKGDQDKGSTTLEEQLKLAQEELRVNSLHDSSSSSSSSKLRIGVGLPPIDFSKILKSQTLIEVEYQSAYSVVLRGNEETLLLLNGTLAPFWYSIDIVKKHGYQLKEIIESGMGSKGNPTRFYALLEK
jgi:hypothetical protein